MPTYSLGTITASTRAAALIKAAYEREKGETKTAAQILALIRQEIRDRLARRVLVENRMQRVPATNAEDAALDGEVTI